MCKALLAATIRTAFLVATAILVLSGSIMRADPLVAPGSTLTLNVGGIDAVRVDYPTPYLILNQLSLSNITVSGSTGIFSAYSYFYPVGSTVTASPTMYMSNLGGPDSAQAFTLTFPQAGNERFTTTFLAGDISHGPNQEWFYLTGMFSTLPAEFFFEVTDTDGTYTVSNASLMITPEPSSLLLAATGLFGTAAVIRRRFV